MQKRAPSTFAVLADEPGGNDVLYLPGVQVPRECRMQPVLAAAALKLQQLWVYSPDPASAFATKLEHAASAPPDWQPDGESAWYGRYRKNGRVIELYYPALNTNGGEWHSWSAAATPRVLCNALAAYRDALEGLPERSPGSSAQRQIRRRCTLPDPADRLPVALHTRAGAFAWMRPLDPAERSCRYVHSYDKRAMHLAALGSLPLGRGVPEHVGPDEAEEGLAEEAYGYYELVMAGHNCEDDPLLPPCPERDGWYPAPLVKLLMQHGHPFAIRSAWLWPASSRWLEPWYRLLRVARVDLDGEPDPAARVVAKSALKSLYTQGLGWFAGSAPSWDRTADPLYRPDVLDSVIALARANLTRNLDNLAPEAPRPFAIDVDCLYVTSNEPNPYQAMPGLKFGTTPGKYGVHDAAAPLDRELLAAIDSGNLGALRNALGQLVSAT